MHPREEINDSTLSASSFLGGKLIPLSQAVFSYKIRALSDKVFLEGLVLEMLTQLQCRISL